MDKNLIFSDTLTVEQFKAQVNVPRIDVKKNPRTGKLFFTYGVRVGAVSLRGIPQRPMLSLVNPELDREPTEEERRYIGMTIELNGQRVAHPKANGFFYILHEEGQGGAPVLASF